MAAASLTSLASSLALALLSAAGLVVVVLGVVVVGAAVLGPRRGGAGAETLDPHHLRGRSLALGDPVADQQTDDDRHQQHREQPEQPRVAAQPRRQPRRPVRSPTGSPARRARPRPGRRRRAGRRTAARRGTPAAPRRRADRRTGSSAGRRQRGSAVRAGRTILLGGDRYQAHSHSPLPQPVAPRIRAGRSRRLIRMRLERSRACARHAVRRTPPPSSRTRPGRRGTGTRPCRPPGAPGRGCA